jgi:ElaB/YqjD/DUF883 family membrane-anchored ribosome-binding protein
MYGNSTPSTTNSANPPTLEVDDAMQATRPVVDRALDKLSSTAQELREQTSVLAKQGVDAVRERSQQVREQALRASDGTLNYIRDEPVKAVLIAAAAGAALMVLMGLLRKSD